MEDGPEDLRAFIDVPAVSAREDTDVSAETLHRIIDAAGDLFARFGVRKVSVADVAGAAGVSKATMYRYVSGQRSLLELYTARESGKIVMAELAKAPVNPDADALVEIAVNLITEMRSHPVFAKVARDEPQMIADALVDPTMSTHAAALVDLVAPMVEAAGVENPRTTVEAVLRIGITLLVLPPVTAEGRNFFAAATALVRPLVRPARRD